MGQPLKTVPFKHMRISLVAEVFLALCLLTGQGADAGEGDVQVEMPII